MPVHGVWCRVVIDPISMAVGAALVGVGVLVGRKNRKRGVPPPQPKCSCGHGLAEHNPKTKACHAQVRRESGWRKGDGAANEWIWVPCTCQQYVGPEHISSIYVPEALPPS